MENFLVLVLSKSKRNKRLNYIQRTPRYNSKYPPNSKEIKYTDNV